MVSGIPIVVYLDDRTKGGLNQILSSTKQITTATDRWGRTADRATKQVAGGFTDLLGRLLALRYGMTRLFEGLSGYTQMQQMRLSFKVLGGNLQQLRSITKGLINDYELLNIGIQMAAVGISTDITTAYLKSGTAVKQVLGNIVNLNELIESIIQGRTYMFFDKYLPGIAKYGDQLKEAQKESDALVRTQKTLQIVIQHMNDLSGKLYGNISNTNKAMMKFQTIGQNMGRTLIPIFEGLTALIIGLAGIKMLRPAGSYMSFFKKMAVGPEKAHMVAAEYFTKPFDGGLLKGWWKEMASIFGKIIMNSFKYIGRMIPKMVSLILVPLKILQGIWQGIEGSSIIKGIGAGIKGYDPLTGITTMSRGLQLELQQKGVLNLVRDFMFLWHHGTQFIRGFTQGFKDVLSVFHSFGKAVGWVLKQFGFYALADIFGEKGWLAKSAGYVTALAFAFWLLKPAILAVHGILGPWGLALAGIVLAVVHLYEELGSLKNIWLAVGLMGKWALDSMTWSALKLGDTLKSAGFTELMNQLGHAIGIPFKLGTLAGSQTAEQFAQEPGVILSRDDMKKEWQSLMTGQAMSSGVEQAEREKNRKILEDIRQILEDGKTIELDGVKVNKALTTSKKAEERRGQ